MLHLKPSYILQSLAILLYVALIVFLPTLHFMPNNMYLHDAQRLLQLILLAWVLIYSMFSWQAISNLIPVSNKTKAALYIVLALAAISSFFAQYPRHAIIEISIFACLCYLALFFAGLYCQNRDAFKKYFFLGLWVSIALYIFAFFVGYLTACIFKTPVTWPQPLLGFNNTRLFNQYQLWGLGLAYLPLLTNQNKNKSLILNIALVLWWAILYYTASRGVLVAWLAGLAITAFTYRKQASPIISLQIVHAFVGFCTYYFLFKFIPSSINTGLVTGELVRNTISDRTGLWSTAVALTLEHPIFGVGPMHFPWYGPTHFHPHNSILQLTSEWGLPATFALLFLSGYGLYYWLKRFGPNNSATQLQTESDFSVLLFFTIVTNAAYSLVDGVIVMPMSQVMMFTVIGIMIGQYHYDHYGISSPISTSSIHRKLKFRPIFAGVVLIALVWSNLPEVKQGMSGKQTGFTSETEKINPRIWIQMAPPPKNTQVH